MLIDEWGTMGRKRPTLNDLKELCVKAGAMSGASYISHEILGGCAIGPNLNGDSLSLATMTLNAMEANVDQFDELLESELLTIDNSDFINSPILPANDLKAHQVPFRYLCKISDNFNDNRIVGRGGFANVYMGITERSNVKIAIKKLKSGVTEEEIAMMSQQLNYEVDQLPRLKHPNIIDLLGFSNDVPLYSCLLYPYMPNGTLESKLAAVRSGVQELATADRLMILKGIAEGINRLHTNETKVMIHRDIKPSNILLDDDLTPKIADFGLLRYGVSGQGESISYTQCAKGTPVYMAPEAAGNEQTLGQCVWSMRL